MDQAEVNNKSVKYVIRMVMSHDIKMNIFSLLLSRYACFDLCYLYYYFSTITVNIFCHFLSRTSLTFMCHNLLLKQFPFYFLHLIYVIHLFFSLRRKAKLHKWNWEWIVLLFQAVQNDLIEYVLHAPSNIQHVMYLQMGIV